MYDKCSSDICLMYESLRISSGVFVHRVERSSPTVPRERTLLPTSRSFSFSGGLTEQTGLFVTDGFFIRIVFDSNFTGVFLGVVMTPNLASLAATRVVVMTTHGIAIDGKVSLGFHCYCFTFRKCFDDSHWNHVISLSLSPLNEVKGCCGGDGCPSFRRSVRRLWTESCLLYLPQYLPDQFHIHTSIIYQPISESVRRVSMSRVEFVFKFQNFIFFPVLHVLASSIWPWPMPPPMLTSIFNVKFWNSRVSGKDGSDSFEFMNIKAVNSGILKNEKLHIFHPAGES